MILDARVPITCSVVCQYSFKSKRQVLQAVRLFRSNFRPNWRYLWRDYSKNLSAWHVSFLSSTSDTKLDDVLEMIYMALSAFSAQHVWDHIRNKNWSVRVTKSEKCNAAVKTYKQEEKCWTKSTSTFCSFVGLFCWRMVIKNLAFSCLRQIFLCRTMKNSPCKTLISQPCADWRRSSNQMLIITCKSWV